MYKFKKNSKNIFGIYTITNNDYLLIPKSSKPILKLI